MEEYSDPYSDIRLGEGGIQLAVDAIPPPPPPPSPSLAVNMLSLQGAEDAAPGAEDAAPGAEDAAPPVYAVDEHDIPPNQLGEARNQWWLYSRGGTAILAASTNTTEAQDYPEKPTIGVEFASLLTVAQDAALQANIIADIERAMSDARQSVEQINKAKVNIYEGDTLVMTFTFSVNVDDNQLIDVESVNLVAGLDSQALKRVETTLYYEDNSIEDSSISETNSININYPTPPSSSSYNISESWVLPGFGILFGIMVGIVAFKAKQRLGPAPPPVLTAPPPVPTVAVAPQRLGDFPESFYCPITCDLMVDPVIGEDGHSYERAAIEQWLRGHRTSPVTRMPLRDLRPNRQLQQAIVELVERAARTEPEPEPEPGPEPEPEEVVINISDDEEELEALRGEVGNAVISIARNLSHSDTHSNTSSGRVTLRLSV